MFSKLVDSMIDSIKDNSVRIVSILSIYILALLGLVMVFSKKLSKANTQLDKAEKKLVEKDKNLTEADRQFKEVNDELQKAKSQITRSKEEVKEEVRKEIIEELSSPRSSKIVTENIVEDKDDVIESQSIPRKTVQIQQGV